MKTTPVPSPVRQRRLPLVTVAAALACGLLPGMAEAEIYGWVDSTGAVTYSNLPPPKDAKVTDVIHETVMSPQAVAEANQRAQVSALNDRIRLLELEVARSQREVVDYPAAPAAPAGFGCPPDYYGDCNAQWGMYYPGGVLWGVGDRGRYFYRGDGRNHPHPAHGPQSGPMRLSHVSASRGSGAHAHR